MNYKEEKVTVTTYAGRFEVNVVQAGMTRVVARRENQQVARDLAKAIEAALKAHKDPR